MKRPEPLKMERPVSEEDWKEFDKKVSQSINLAEKAILKAVGQEEQKKQVKGEVATSAEQGESNESKLPPRIVYEIKILKMIESAIKQNDKRYNAMYNIYIADHNERIDLNKQVSGIVEDVNGLRISVDKFDSRLTPIEKEIHSLSWTSILKIAIKRLVMGKAKFLIL